LCGFLFLTKENGSANTNAIKNSSSKNRKTLTGCEFLFRERIEKMNYRELKRRVRVFASEHLYSLELYKDFPEEDEGKIERAIREIQEEILNRVSKRVNVNQTINTVEPGAAVTGLTIGRLG
jgi:CRISPR/Cas system-associated protein Cas5 (RAMP superfamily)